MLSEALKRKSDDGIGREDGFLAGHHALHDRAADADRVDQFRAAVLEGPRNQLSRGGVAEHHDAAIGLGKDRQQAVEHFRQDLVQRHGAAQVPADLGEGLELGSGIDLQPQARRTRGNIQPRHDRGIAPAGLVVDHQGRGPGIGDGAAAAGSFLVGRVGMENHDDVAERDAVLIVQQASLADLAAVDVGAVAALHVLDIELVVDPLDPRMLAADRPGVEHDIAVGMPAQDGRLAIQREHSARVRAFNRA